MGLNKTDYIRVHGEAAWEIESQKRKKYQAKYRELHKKERKEYQHQYYIDNLEAINAQKKEYNEKNKESIKKKRKQYYEDNKPSILEGRKRYREENKDKVAESNKRWRKNNSDYVKEKQQKYYSTKIGRAKHLIQMYNQADMNRGYDISNNVDEKWITNNIFTSKCVYCGDSNWKHLGCDRIDETIPHTEDNIVCSCGICNRERSNQYSVEEFVEYRKTNPRDNEFKLPQQIVEVNGIKVIRKKAV